MKKKIISIITSILGVVILCLSFWYLSTEYKSSSDGVITIRLIDLKGDFVLEKEIEFYENDSLIDILKENFNNVQLDEYGFFQSIEDFKTTYASNSMIYISLIVDGRYSEVGINLIEFTDGTVIEFKLEEYKYE